MKLNTDSPKAIRACLGVLTIAVSLLLGSIAKAIPLLPGDIIASTDRRIVRSHPVTGIQTEIAFGGLLDGPVGVVVDSDGRILVATGGANRIVRIDPITGQPLEAHPSIVGFELDGEEVAEFAVEVGEVGRRMGQGGDGEVGEWLGGIPGTPYLIRSHSTQGHAED